MEHTGRVSTDSDRPSVRHGIKSAVNVAWLADSVTATQILAFRDAWEPLADREEWRAWSLAHLQSSRPFLYLAVRDDLDRRKLLKTKRGISAHVPVADVAAADSKGELIDFYQQVIRDIYAKWASMHSLPAPPPLPHSSSGTEPASVRRDDGGTAVVPWMYGDEPATQRR